jgi:hypothetical protein
VTESIKQTVCLCACSPRAFRMLLPLPAASGLGRLQKHNNEIIMNNKRKKALFQIRILSTYGPLMSGRHVPSQNVPQRGCGTLHITCQVWRPYGGRGGCACVVRSVVVCYTRMSIPRIAFASIMSARPSAEVCSATDDVERSRFSQRPKV